MGLISVERARQQIPQAAGADNAVLQSMIDAASLTIAKYCRRDFTYQTYDELLTGSGTQFLYVSNPPLNQVHSVRNSLLPALYLTYQPNSPTSQTQSANVIVTETGVTINHLIDNVETSNTFLYSEFPTFELMGEAMKLVPGWNITIPEQFKKWQTRDIAVQTGSWSARNLTVALSVYWYGLSYYLRSKELGELYAPGGWIPQVQGYRVTYTGGFAEIPEDLQQACAELVQLMFASRQANPLMQSETIDKYSYSRDSKTGFDQLSIAAKTALNSYRILRAARYK